MAMVMLARVRPGFKPAVRVRVLSENSVRKLAEPLNSAEDVLNFWFGHNYLTQSATNQLIVANTVGHVSYLVLHISNTSGIRVSCTKMNQKISNALPLD